MLSTVVFASEWNV